MIRFLSREEQVSQVTVRSSAKYNPLVWWGMTNSSLLFAAFFCCRILPIPSKTAGVTWLDGTDVVRALVSHIGCLAEQYLCIFNVCVPDRSIHETILSVSQLNP